MSAIDTVYEYAGYSLAGKLQAVLWGTGLPLIVALAGVAWTVHTVTEKGSIKDLALYTLYLFFAGWLVSSAPQQGVPTPRFAAWLGRAADLVQKRSVTAIHRDFLTAPFEWERIAAMVGAGRITDAPLAERVHRFLESCAKVALAAAPGPPTGNLLRAGQLPYGDSCERTRSDLWSRLERHVKENAFHRELLSTAAARDPAGGPAFRERYLDQLCASTFEAPGSPVSERALLVAALGDYAYATPDVSVGMAERLVGIFFGGTPIHSENQDAILGPSEIVQAIDLQVSTRQKYYLATVLAPHLLGLSLMVLLGLFPLVGLFALLPGKWRALVRYAETLVSVKLWPVCWASLTVFNAKRSVHEVFEPAERGSAGVAFAVAAFYLLTPALCFMVVHLATAAVAMPFAQAVPPPSGPPISPAGAVSGAVRQIPR